MSQSVRAAKRGARVTLQLYKETEPLVERARKEMHVTCVKGCHHCCKLPASAMLPEAVLIAQHLMARRDWAKEKPELVRRVREQLPIFAEVTVENRDSYFMKQLPCIFLRDGECSVYPVRPSTCRFHMVVTNPENCALGAADPSVGMVNLKKVEAQVEIEGARAIGRVTSAPIPVIIAMAFWMLEESFPVDAELVRRGVWLDEELEHLDRLHAAGLL